MPGLPSRIEKLALRAVRTPQSGVETARLLEILAIPGGDVSLIFKNHPTVTDRELRAALHAAADLVRELDSTLEDAPRIAGKRQDSKTETPAAAVRRPSRSRHLWPVPGPRHVLVHIDGCSKGNPGPAGIGVQFLTIDGKPLAEYCEAIGETTNNVAEYRAMIAAVRIALDHGVERVSAFTDSQLLARQINGQYRVKNPGLKPLFEDVSTLIGRLKEFEITDVRREQNSRADELANMALERASAAARRRDSFSD